MFTPEDLGMPEMNQVRFRKMRGSLACDCRRQGRYFAGERLPGNLREIRRAE